MLLILAIVGLAFTAAATTYLWRERMGLEGVGLTVLRGAALATVGLLLLNPSWMRREAAGPPTVLLDASLSMAVGGAWDAALDTALVLGAAGGVVLQFGAEVVPIDTQPPTDGASRIRDALIAARAAGRPVYLVTDGELDDAAGVAPTLLRGVTPVLVPRSVGSGAALSDVVVPGLVRRVDTLPFSVSIERWGDLEATDGMLEVYDGARRLLAQPVSIPSGARRVRREAALAPNVLARGDRVLRFLLSLARDPAMHDNERRRVVSVTDQPAIVAIVDPADWEGRFLVRTLVDVVGGPVEAFARTGERAWLNMRRVSPVSAERVRSAVRQASLVVARIDTLPGFLAGRRGPLWHWPAGAGRPLFEGDWYALADVGASPLAGAFAGVPWDSLPPLSGILPLGEAPDAWVALTARRGRRGPSRPVLVGNESDGRRTLVTAAAGAWRWGFRGGVSREAYRGMIATGVDWLLRSSVASAGVGLSAGPVVPRGVRVPFRWHGGDAPDTAVVALEGAEGADTVVLVFDDRGAALVMLAPGEYRWRSVGRPGSSGTIVVESYSPEYVPRMPAGLAATGGEGPETEVPVSLRSQWWLVLVAMAALAGEWAWRRRRGLP